MKLYKMYELSKQKGKKWLICDTGYQKPHQ